FGGGVLVNFGDGADGANAGVGILQIPDRILGGGGNGHGFAGVKLDHSQGVLIYLPQLLLLVVGFVVKRAPVLLVHVKHLVGVAVILVERLNVDHVGVAQFPVAHRRPRPSWNRKPGVQYLVEVGAIAGAGRDVRMHDRKDLFLAQVLGVEQTQLERDTTGVVILRPVGA